MRPLDADRLASEAGVTGVIILGGIVAHEFLERLQQVGLPFVAVGSHAHPMRTNYVMADVAKRDSPGRRSPGGARKATHCTGNGPATTGTSAAKLDGYRLALATNDLPYRAGAVAGPLRLTRATSRLCNCFAQILIWTPWCWRRPHGHRGAQGTAPCGPARPAG